MVPYSSPPVQFINIEGHQIASFEGIVNENIDLQTVSSFGDEWSKFNAFDQKEIEKIGNHYFDLLPNKVNEFIALDVGCGSGRWAAYLTSRVRFIEAVDPSNAVFAAHKLLKSYPNTRVTHASSETLPFQDGTFDLVYSLGVLHHIPDTQKAIKQCYEKTKSGGYFLLYLYYALDNRGIFFRFLFKLTNLLRLGVSALPSSLKMIVCDVIAIIIYWPLANISKLLDSNSITRMLVKFIPLSYYRSVSFYIMRNDALDRFGTPLEKRFSKREIAGLLKEVGFENITFSDKQPYWHVIAQKC